MNHGYGDQRGKPSRTIGEHPADLFNMIHARDGYNHIGKDLSYKFFVDHRTNTIYCCFQGSNGLRDWINNFLFMPSRRAGRDGIDNKSVEPYRDCGWRVHFGFARVWRSGNEQVMREARELFERYANSKAMPNGGWGPYDIVFAGFSHGGPLAQLAAENWHFLHRRNIRPVDPVRCIIFGSPKLAWGERALLHLRRTLTLTSWINQADVITTVPLRWWGFRHVAKHLVNVRRIPVLSKLRVKKHHLVYGLKNVYPPRF